MLIPAKKSVACAVLLTLFFGPLGLLYANALCGVAFMFLAVISASSIIGPIFLWILSILFSIYFVEQFNNSVERTEKALGIRLYGHTDT